MDDLPLSDALKYAEADLSSVIREDAVYPEAAMVTAKGEQYWRESAAYHNSFFSSLGISKQHHFKIWNAVSHAFENAFLRGNKAARNKPIVVRVYEGLQGKVIRIEDQGDGFDYVAAVRNFRLSGRSSGSGKGFKVLNDSPVLAGYEGKGNIINIVVMNKDLK